MNELGEWLTLLWFFILLLIPFAVIGSVLEKFLEKIRRLP